MDGSWNSELRVALRGLVRRPGFAGVAILILGLGIGANAAIYGLLDAVLFTPLPFPEPERLVQIWETAERESLELRSLSFPILEDLEREEGIFESVAGIHRTAVNLSGDSGEPERVTAEMVSTSYFSLLGMTPIAGRLWSEEEDRPDLTVVPVVLSEALWTRRFGADVSVIGRPVHLNEVACEVIGVVTGQGVAGDVALWTPLRATPLIDANVPGRFFEQRGARWLGAVGSLDADVPLESAHAFMEQETLRLREAHPRVMERRGVMLIHLEEGLLGDIRRASASLMIAVLLVLLITCANLAGLLLARAGEREREIALRLAVGASRTRLARQLLTESLVLSFFGGALGIGLAAAFETLLPRAAFLGDLPGYVRVDLDAGSFVFASFLAVSTSVLFGGAPAVALARSNLVDAMRGRAVSRSGGARPSLVVVQVALALALTIGAVLVLKSFSRALAVDPGFSPASVYTLRVELPQNRYDGESAVVFARSLEERLESLPSVDRVALASDVPLVDGYSAINLRIEDRFLRDPQDRTRTYHHRVSPGFFSTLGIPLLKGRDFAWTDTEGTPLVAIVTEAMAADAWPGEEPLGKRVSSSGRDGSWREVVGVVGNIRYRNLLYDPVSSPEDPDIFFPLSQAPTRDLGVVVRVDRRRTLPLPVGRVREELRALDSALPIFGVRDMEDVVSAQLSMARLVAALLVGSGGLAVVLAALGIYGLLAQRVVEKRFEIGIRIAVGAGRGDVVQWMMASGLKLAGAGLIAGFIGSVVFGRYLESQLFEIAATDPFAFLIGGVTLAAVSGLASYLPARRAARTDPTRLLGVGS